MKKYVRLMAMAVLVILLCYTSYMPAEADTPKQAETNANQLIADIYSQPPGMLPLGLTKEDMRAILEDDSQEARDVINYIFENASDDMFEDSGVQKNRSSSEWIDRESDAYKVYAKDEETGETIISDNSTNPVQRVERTEDGELVTPHVF